MSVSCFCVIPACIFVLKVTARDSWLSDGQYGTVWVLFARFQSTSMACSDLPQAKVIGDLHKQQFHRRWCCHRRIALLWEATSSTRPLIYSRKRRSPKTMTWVYDYNMQDICSWQTICCSWWLGINNYLLTTIPGQGLFWIHLWVHLSIP